MSTIDQQYLYCPCPAENCINKTQPSYWVHSNCGGKTKIRYSELDLLCSECSKQGTIFDWRFACQKHTYEQTSKVGWASAMIVMASQDGVNQMAIRKALAKIAKFGFVQ